MACPTAWGRMGAASSPPGHQYKPIGYALALGEAALTPPKLCISKMETSGQDMDATLNSETVTGESSDEHEDVKKFLDHYKLDVLCIPESGLHGRNSRT